VGVFVKKEKAPCVKNKELIDVDLAFLSGYINIP